MILARKTYKPPFLLAFSTYDIGLTDSQEGELGGGGDTDYSSFWNWWNSEDVAANQDLLLEAGFDPNNPATWEKFGFDINDPTTWDAMFDLI